MGAPGIEPGTSREQLAEHAATTPDEVSRALAYLARQEVGALVRLDRGSYMLNPAIAWAGTRASREAAEAELRRQEAGGPRRLSLVPPAE